jgi:hypothetical protein
MRNVPERTDATTLALRCTLHAGRATVSKEMLPAKNAACHGIASRRKRSDGRVRLASSIRSNPIESVRIGTTLVRIALRPEPTPFEPSLELVGGSALAGFDGSQLRCTLRRTRSSRVNCSDTCEAHFMGAQARNGLFAAAHGGTLFLDGSANGHSLRKRAPTVLEDGMVHPVGT